MSDEPLSAIKEPPTNSRKKTPFKKELIFAHIFVLLSSPIIFLGLLAFQQVSISYFRLPEHFHHLIISIFARGPPVLIILQGHSTLYTKMFALIWAAQISIYFYSLKYAFNDHKIFSNIWVRRYLAACIGGFVGYLVVFGIFDHFFIYHKYNRVPF